MGLFIIFRHLVAPLVGYANLQDQLARKQQLEDNIKRIPPQRARPAGKIEPFEVSCSFPPHLSVSMS